AARRQTHRRGPFVLEAARFWARYADTRLRLAGHGGLRLDLDGAARVGDMNADVVVAGTAFELLRVLTGRRSRAQADAVHVERGVEVAEGRVLVADRDPDRRPPGLGDVLE